MNLIHILALVAILMALAAFALPPLLHRLDLLQAENTYDAAVEVHEGAVTRTNDVAVTARHLLWTQGAAPMSVKLATASLPALGTIDNTEASVDVRQSVLLLSKGDTKKMVASEAITAGTHLAVYQAAGGKVATTGTIYVGRPLTSAAADGDILEVADASAKAFGYGSGAGGAVTQITSSSTGVSLSKGAGQITTVALTTAAAAEERFTVTNTLVAATDVIVLATTYNGNGTPALSVCNVTAGTFDVVITNLHASAALNAAMVINFAVIKGVAA